MKKIVFFIVFLILQHQGHGQGIQFFKGNWQEITLKSKQENKAIYLDFYTSWCGPCKKMDKEFFSNSEVNQKIENDFLFYKLDAEKGEGIALAKKFSIDSYPTGVFVATNGEVFYRINGYRSVDSTLIQFEKASAQNKDFNLRITLKEAEMQYQQGNRDSVFVLDLVRRKARNRQNYGIVFDDFWVKLSEQAKKSKDAKKLLLEFPLPTNTKAYSDFVSICTMGAKFKENNELRRHWTNSINYSFRLAAVTKDTLLFETALKAATQKLELDNLSSYNNFNQEETKKRNIIINNEYKYSFYLAIRDSVKFQILTNEVMTPIEGKTIEEIRIENQKDNDLLKAIGQKFSTYSQNDKKNEVTLSKTEKTSVQFEGNSIPVDFIILEYTNYFYTYARGIYLLKNEKTALKKALAWIDKAIILGNNKIDFLLLKSKLLYKIGNRIQAIEAQKIAVKVANNDKDEIEILNKMKKGIY